MQLSLAPVQSVGEDDLEPGPLASTGECWDCRCGSALGVCSAGWDCRDLFHGVNLDGTFGGTSCLLSQSSTELRVITQWTCHRKGCVPQIPGQGQLLVCELLRDVMILVWKWIIGHI